MTLLNDLLFIASSRELVFNFFLCAFMGLGSFFVAVRLCSIKDIGAKILKYIMATISIAFTSNFFMLVSAPHEFSAAIISMFATQLSFAMIIVWAIGYELYGIYTNQNSLKNLFGKRSSE